MFPNPQYVTIECGHLQFGMFMDALVAVGILYCCQVMQLFHAQTLLSVTHISTALR